MKKKSIGAAAMLLLFVLCFMPMVFANYQLTLLIGNNKVIHNQPQPLKIMYDNKLIQGDMPGIIRESRSLVPVRSVFETMGAKVTWDAKTQKVGVSYGEQTITLQVNNKVAQVNGKAVTMDVPAQMIGVVGQTDGARVMVPLRFISENLSQEVKWDGATYTVNISSPTAKEPMNEVTNISYAKKEGYSEVILEMKEEMKDAYEVGILTQDQIRVFVDMRNTTITAKNVPSNIKNDHIINIRTGQNGNVGRVVLDLNKMTKYDVSKVDQRRLSIKIYYSQILNIQVGQENEKETAEILYEEGVSYQVQRDDANQKLWIDFHSAASQLGQVRNSYTENRYLKEIRTSTNEGFYRVVLEYSSGAAYTISEGTNRIKLSFSQKGENNAPIEQPSPPSNPPAQGIPQNTAEVVYLNLNKPVIVIPKAMLEGLSEKDITYTQNLKDKILEITLPNVQLASRAFAPGDANINRIGISTKGKNSVITITGKFIYEYGISYNENKDLIITLLRPREKFNKILVIDPGHGGWDPGAVANGMRESDINLDVALKLNELLKGTDIKVYMTRETDVDLGAKTEDLYGRVRIANDIEADLFVSIHNNKFNTKAYGTETFYHGGANTQGTGLTSAKAANIIHNDLIKALGSYDRKVKTANFVVIRETKMPSILVEGGFMDHPQEAAKLKTQEYRMKMAQGIFEGIKKVFQQFQFTR